MDPIVESALISAAATFVGVGGTAAVAIIGFRNSRSTNQATIDAARATTDKAVDAARDTNKATIDAAHADVHRTLEATRDGQIADRYTKAIEQLGSSTIDVTIGGIYALERIAQDSPRDHPTVMEVLAACIREHSREQWPKPDPDGMTHERSTRPDIQAALTVIGRRTPERDIRTIDLARANLIGAILSGAILRKADLTGAILRKADLTGANLSGADLAGADLAFADLTGATLAGATLVRAILSGAILRKADLTGANLTFANLTGANMGPRDDSDVKFVSARDTERLRGANLTGADLAFADLTGAGLTGAILTDADLTGAKLRGAYLTGADLTGAILIDVDLDGVDFASADLTGAQFPDGRPPPEGWTRHMGTLKSTHALKRGSNEQRKIGQIRRGRPSSKAP